MLTICSGFAWCQWLRVESWLLFARVGDVFRNIFVWRCYFLGDGKSARRVAQFDFCPESLTNGRYTCVSMRPVSGWTLVMVRLVELGRLIAARTASVSVFGCVEVLCARKYVLGH